MEFKPTRRLFKGTYQYKIVLVCAGAGWFRSGNWDYALEQLTKVDLDSIKVYRYSNSIKTKEDLEYALKLQAKLSSLDDIDVRVESPWITVYTNDKKNVDELIALNSDHVKYVCIPPGNLSLDENTIIMPKVDYEFRITLGKTTHEHSGFVEWAQSNSKVKLTKSCISALLKPRSWGGTHFYITGEKNLMLARMHLGGSIAKVERIIKA